MTCEYFEFFLKVIMSIHDIPSCKNAFVWSRSDPGNLAVYTQCNRLLLICSCTLQRCVPFDLEPVFYQIQCIPMRLNNRLQNMDSTSISSPTSFVAFHTIADSQFPGQPSFTRLTYRLKDCSIYLAFQLFIKFDIKTWVSYI